MQRKWVVTGWVAAALVAGAAGVGAVALTQGGSLNSPDEPWSNESVEEALAEAEAESATPGEGSASPESESPSPTGPSDEASSPSPGTGEEVFGGDGGTFTVTCDGSQATIESWAPAQGWQVSNVVRGPASTVEIEFEGSDDEFEYAVSCVDGVPQTGSGDDDADD